MLNNYIQFINENNQNDLDKLIDKLIDKLSKVKKLYFKIGSSTESKSTYYDKKEIKEKIYKIISNYLFDWEFYHNWLDEKYQEEYLEFFNNEIYPEIKNNIYKYIIYENNILKINNNINKREYISNYILNSNKLPKEIKEIYKQYRHKDAHESHK